MATNELNENYEIQLIFKTHLPFHVYDFENYIIFKVVWGHKMYPTYHTIIRSMMPVFSRPTHESFPFSPDYFGLGKQVGA